jgi:serine/threonine protein kinase
MLKREKLGEGTFGIVYAGYSPKSGHEVAIKRNLAEDDMSFIGVSRELDMLNKLRDHPYIVELDTVIFGYPFANGVFSPLNGADRDSQRDDNVHFVFSKASYDLHQFIYGAETTDFSLIKRYMIQMLLGSEYMHSKNIIHRDLKPSNILIFTKDVDILGINNVAKICDLGLAKPYTYQGVQTPNIVTSWYRAPEITLGYPFYDYKVDVWGMGCIFFEMIAKNAFVANVPDSNDDILSAILGKLPEALPLRKIRELIRSNKWRAVKLTAAASPRTRKSFTQQFGLSQRGIKQFNVQAGKIELFSELLENMLKFEWGTRYTISQCIDHKFFDEYRTLIDAMRKKYISDIKEDAYNVRDCVERNWMAEIVVKVFNNRFSLQKWYSHRILFQAMDLYDRYLTAMFSVTQITPAMVESDSKGYIHDKYNAELRFMVCLYLSIKYFSSIHYPIPFADIVSEEFQTPNANLIAEQFEGGLIKNCLSYDIYRPTLYEIADKFDNKLDDVDVRDLIILYSMNTSINGLTPSQVYRYYYSKLRGNSLEFLRSPIVINLPTPA